LIAAGEQTSHPVTGHCGTSLTGMQSVSTVQD
jgi:hypothetical protein